MFNWEELGKIDSSLLRTMRHITFGTYSASYDGAYFGKKKKVYGNEEIYIHELDEDYPIIDVKPKKYEEWPSEKWNFQDKFPLKSIKSMKVENIKKEETPVVTGDEAAPKLIVSKKDLEEILTSVDGIGKKKVEKIFESFEKEELVDALEQEPSALTKVKGITKKLVDAIVEKWNNFKKGE